MDDLNFANSKNRTIVKILHLYTVIEKFYRGHKYKEKFMLITEIIILHELYEI